jgi:hypothetical protein
MYATQTGVQLHTTKRVVFFAKGIVTTVMEEFQLDKITSLQYTTGMLMGDITILRPATRQKSRRR